LEVGASGDRKGNIRKSCSFLETRNGSSLVLGQVDAKNEWKWLYVQATQKVYIWTIRTKRRDNGCKGCYRCFM